MRKINATATNRSRSPFDFAQGRLFRDGNRRQRQNKTLELVVLFAGLIVALMWLFVDLSWWLIASLRVLGIGLVGAAGNTPAPGGHGGFFDGRAGGEGGVDDGEAGAPLQVGYEGGAELGIGGELEFVGGFEEEGHPTLALLVSDVSVEVVADHLGVSSMEGGVVGGAAKDLADELGNVSEVLR
jgi:hypothetical protein